MGWKAVTLQDVLNKTKDFDSRADGVVTAKIMGLSSVRQCFICDVEEIDNRGELPDGWKVVKNYNYILCPDCANKLRERVGK